MCIRDRCKTDRGMLELKKTYADDESLEREYILKEYLKARGMNGVDISYRTTEDMPCYRMDENAYVLIKYIPCLLYTSYSLLLA